MKKSFFVSFVFHIFLFGFFSLFLKKYTFFNEEVKVVKISSIKSEKKDFCKQKIKKCEIKEKKRVLKSKLVKKTPRKKVEAKITPKQIKKAKPLFKKASKKKPAVQKSIEEAKKILKENISKRVEKGIEKEKKISKNLSKNEKGSIEKEKRSFLEFIYKVKKAIEENKKYPKIARRLKKEGIVEVEFVITADGELKSLRVIKSCDKILDKSAIKTIKRASLYFPKPLKEIKIKVPIEYRLTQN